jgi:NAD(P)-dependent dehydrogenase (short-subunit alcohol dehydrogenase family)
MKLNSRHDDRTARNINSPFGTVKGEKQMPSLKDKTVLIIGRGSGIARAIALAVGEDGGRVIAAGRNPDDLTDAYRALDVGVERADVTDESSVAAVFKARSAANPARRIGSADDIATAAVAILTNGFITGVSIPVDGGEHLV